MIKIHHQQLAQEQQVVEVVVLQEVHHQLMLEVQKVVQVHQMEMVMQAQQGEVLEQYQAVQHFIMTTEVENN